MSFFENTKKPEGLGGKIMVAMMNSGHGKLADWGMSFLGLSTDAAVLDCGCGGGANLCKLLKRYPNGTVTGIDYSSVSVEKSKKLNAKTISEGRCCVLEASVAVLPFEDNKFDVVTAFETVYFWPGLVDCFREVYRVTKTGGIFLICNEATGDTDKNDKWTQLIDGMTIYRDAQLKTALREAGFTNIQIHKNKKDWLCVTGQKQEKLG
ncbi:class I SAM-dependent methyltransferase [Lachnospiraceae bacterium OM04-12BH]|nr:class I SAM-dependent methyltransferase [Lachnospiraceae bacterium OM04-12BH]